jgi:hypothetical protein
MLTSLADHPKPSHLPVSDAVRPFIPEGQLIRGRVIACSGDAALSVALLLVAQATQEGSWLAVVGVQHIAILAAVERGIALERLVLVHPPQQSKEWSTTVAAVVDGFDLIIMSPPRGVSPSDVRRVQTRIQARQSVAIIVNSDSSGVMSSSQLFHPDVALHTTTSQWVGADQGAGFLQHRDVRVQVSGRRVPRPTEHIVRHIG